MQSRLDFVNDWEDRFRRCGFKASAVAQDCGVTLRYLQKYFHARFGTKPHTWSLNLRMEQAERLLTQGMPVKVIAFELGYKAAAHFSRDFKRFHGNAPRSYLFRTMRRG